MNFSVIAAFTIVLVVLAIGEFVSIKSKAFVPSVFISAVIFLIGFWTVLPKDIIAKASIAAPLVPISMYMLLVHMGTLMSLKELFGQWKTILISLSGILGICIMVLTFGRMFFGWEAAIAATPPLAGGVVASILMSDAATKLGLPQIAVLATCMYIMQGFAGYPISAYLLKKEAKRVLGLYRAEGSEFKAAKAETAAVLAPRKKLIPPLPEEYQTTYVILLKLGIVAWIASVVGPAIHVNEYVVCLILGVIFCELGFLEEKALIKANSFGFLMTILMGFIFASLAKATPAMLAQIAGPLFGIIVLGVIGMYIMSLIFGKILGESKHMAFACTLTALYGFPADYILTHEAIKSVCKTQDEKEYVINNMLPKMLVAGFTTVTIASVVLAGFFVKLL